MKVDFLRWEEGDPIGWLSRAEHYFRFYRTADATRVEIAGIHLDGDAIQWFNWFKYTHGGLCWQRFNEGLLDRFGPTDFNNIDGQLAKIQVKARQPYTLMAAISFARIQEEQLNREVRRTRVAPRPAMPRPTAPSTVIQAPAPKKLTRDKLRERSAKELCWHYDEPWSREHHCKKGRLLVIEPAEDEDNETSEEALEEESQPANYAYRSNDLAAPVAVIHASTFLSNSIIAFDLNQLWVLMQCSLISGYFHDFTEEWTMMLKVFPDVVPGSTAHDCKNE
ncbi:hypothetical protein GW17_00033324 [Ensete ventricosum]|nr:hypothetical protein GW17_00033324 [Ensete ventricosum]